MSPIRHDVPSWRRPESFAIRPGPVLGVLTLVAMLLLEVGQSAAVRSLSVQLSDTTRQLQLANAELEWAQSAQEDGLDRAGVAPMAAGLGLRPTDPRQFVALPAEYLAKADTPAAGERKGLLAAIGRTFSPLVPDAAARGRDVN